ncbi:TetR/AcrR family transcriptional regulator [Clostridium bornimense]|uniref:TetR/AcrR family transcriptional regulator n=1 Tax=Clostridium bornimense TaxID=1216932 RepID=UPI001C100AEC|nr:TetR/AcrR family transcriptional regulator [Clostridium bornimense]MBU5316597.1 TetR/AcrR family transcriptional regulator [Clostridium bornimense]
MPKNTFFNLPKDKRNKIIKCAKKEFSKYNFYDASINRIIKEANISRGSFYQYFENKEDLFIYLLGEFRDRILSDLEHKIIDIDCDIFQFQLLIFDYITTEVVKSKDKDFIISIICNMDIRLEKHLSQFIQCKEFTSVDKLPPHIKSTKNIRINEDNELEILNNLLISSLINELVAFFTISKSLESCRESLMVTADILKHGVINNK